MAGNSASANDWNTTQFNSSYKGCMLVTRMHIEVLKSPLNCRARFPFEELEDSHEIEL